MLRINLRGGEHIIVQRIEYCGEASYSITDTNGKMYLAHAEDIESIDSAPEPASNPLPIPDESPS